MQANIQVKKEQDPNAMDVDGQTNPRIVRPNSLHIPSHPNSHAGQWPVTPGFMPPETPRIADSHYPLTPRPGRGRTKHSSKHKQSTETNVRRFPIVTSGEAAQKMQNLLCELVNTGFYTRELEQETLFEETEEEQELSEPGREDAEDTMDPDGKSSSLKRRRRQAMEKWVAAVSSKHPKSSNLNRRANMMRFLGEPWRTLLRGKLILSDPSLLEHPPPEVSFPSVFRADEDGWLHAFDPYTNLRGDQPGAKNSSGCIPSALDGVSSHGLPDLSEELGNSRVGSKGRGRQPSPPPRLLFEESPEPALQPMVAGPVTRVEEREDDLRVDPAFFQTEHPMEFSSVDFVSLFGERLEDVQPYDKNSERASVPQPLPLPSSAKALWQRELDLPPSLLLHQIKRVLESYEDEQLHLPTSSFWAAQAGEGAHFKYLFPQKKKSIGLDGQLIFHEVEVKIFTSQTYSVGLPWNQRDKLLRSLPLEINVKPHGLVNFNVILERNLQDPCQYGTAMKRTMRRISEYFEILNQVWEEIFQLRNLYQSNLSAVIQCPTEAEECLSIRMRWAFVEEEELPFSPSVWPTLLVHIPWHYPFRAPSWAFLGLYDHLPSTASFLSIFRELHCRYASMDHDQTLGGEDEGGNEPREEEGPLYGRGFAHLVQSWLEACLSFVDQNEL